jgi:hypothetical protein
MIKVFPPCRDQFGKRIRGAIVYRTRKFGSKRLVWNGKVFPDAYFLLPRY